MLGLAGIILLLCLLVQWTPVQNFIAQQALHYLAAKTGTKVGLQKLSLRFFNAAVIEGLYVEDRAGDTLVYAGEVQLRITDLLFAQGKPTIKYIGLRDAHVRLFRARNSKTWNYQFLLDAFAPGKPASARKQQEANPQIDLRNLDLEQVSFQMIDEWVGTDMIGTVGRLGLVARQLDFRQKRLQVKTITGDSLLFGLRAYQGGKPPSARSQSLPVIDSTPFNPGLWSVTLDDIQLRNSRFFLEEPDSKAPAGFFDERNLDITGIQLQAKAIRIEGDTLRADLRQLQARERCGLEIREMSALVKVSPNISECKQLLLRTNNSVLRDYYAMHYDRFPDFTDYLTKVVMAAELKNSEVGIQDIIYFAPDLRRFENISVRISGKGRGTVGLLDVSDLLLDDGVSRLSGHLRFKGLPDIDRTYIDFEQGRIQTSGAAFLLYAPELRKEPVVDWSALHQINFEGGFSGLIADFRTYGTIGTNLGEIKADVQMQFPRHRAAAYTGTVQAGQFFLGKLLRQEFLGRITAGASVKGQGFDATGTLHINGAVQSLEANGYAYRDIKIDGLMASRKFDGRLWANDPNLQLDFNGKVDFSQPEPLFDLSAKVAHLDAKALNYTRDSIVARGQIKLNFSGDSIDDFIGSAYIQDIDVLRGKSRLNIDSVQLRSSVDERGMKRMTFATNELSVNLNGSFSLIDLPSSAQLFLSYYLPEYVKRPLKVNEDQNLNVDILANNTDDILSLFTPHWRLGAGTRVTGNMDMRHQQLEMKAALPYLKYGGFRVNDIQLNSTGNYSGFSLEAMANGITAGEQDIASSVQFQTRIFQDSAHFQLLTTTPTSLGSAELNGLAYAHNDSFTLHILPSEFYLNQARWEIPGANRIVLYQEHIAIENLRLHSGLQSIAINETHQQQVADSAYIDIRNIDAAAFSGLLDMEDINVEGRINGTVAVSPILKNPLLRFDVTANNLTINNDTLGDALLKGTYDMAKALVVLDKPSGLSYKDASAQVAGTVSVAEDSRENIDAEIFLSNAQVNWLQPFLIGYVHQLSGTADGSIALKGNAFTPLTTGEIRLKDAGFTADITGVHYSIRDARIAVSDTRFELGTILVTDDAGREGTLRGSIVHERLSKMNFRLNMRSDNIQVLNLADYQNENFYGDVKASVQVRLSGPLNNLNLNIFATPQKNSHLYIPIGYGSDVSEYNYIRFKQYGDVQPVRKSSTNKLNIRLDAIATPDLEATIIIDPGTGDQIWAKGSGNIILEIPADGEMRMNGNYIIDEGTYNFSFKQLQVLNNKRQFAINSNSVIKWNGDIADADLDVTAYTQVKTRLYDLIINEVDRIGLTDYEVRDAQIMQMVNVGMIMRGSLKEPDLRFKLDLVENRSVGTYAYQKLQRINTDEKELLNQVASLLLLDQFVPPEGLNNSNAVTTGTINNMSELVSSAASSQITNFANKILGMQDLYVGVRYKNYSLSTASDQSTINYINRNEAGVNLRKSFLKNRLIVEVGGVYDWGRNSAQSDLTANLVGDFRVQYLITEDGRIRFNVFRVSNYDAIWAQTIARQGLGLSYRKSFNGLLDLFRSEEKMRREREKRMKEQQQQSIKAAPWNDTIKSQISFLPSDK